jgi:probable rRNA maturation factor
MNLLIANRQRGRKINSSWLKKIVLAALEELAVEEADLEINLVGATEMASLNETFLQHEGSTDVITFDYGDERRRGKHAHPGLSGELFICIDDAIVQSKEFKTSWQSETVRYVVHGILHLLGHDDLRPQDRRKMKREENRLVAVLSKRFSLAKISRAS